ncbi:PQQ-binding-like beta-propeller repeat protein [Streptomyces sp. NPDC001502]|uniref:outer membrane protein assembly factor BamB family protein n=1 Tax=Streptomyces sp. NPDC001502 TaxID=3364578 RepID=UPI0036738330
MVVRVLDGRYELVRFVGRGGMGEVWEGWDRRIGRRVAVKLLPHGRGDTSEAALFLREAQTAGALDHPGVVTVFDVGQAAADGLLFMVMEFVQGRDLSALLREDGVPPVADAVDWTAQAAAALGRAHTEGVVHRDLKPANLMLTREGRVKVLDFGIARFMESTNHSSKVMGTLAYMPPERFAEHPGDARSDLYSLGCVLHELLTGKVPFEATGPVGMMNAHLLKTPARPSEHRPGIPPALDQLVLDLLAKDPVDRPATAGQVRERLNAATTSALASAGPGDGRPRENADAVATEPNPAAPPRIHDGSTVGATRDDDPVHDAPTVGPDQAGVSDDEERTGADGAAPSAVALGRRRFLWLAAGAAVTAGGITTAVALKDRESPGSGPSASPPTDRSTPGLSRAWSFATGNEVMSAPAVAGGVVYVGSFDNNVYALDAATGAKKWSYTTGSGVNSSPAVAGGVVYIGGGDKNVYALDAATGAKKWSYTTGGEVTSSPVVVDGVVYIGSTDRNVYALEAATGAKKWSYTTGRIYASPAVVGGVVYIGSNEWSVYALDAATGTQKWSYATGDGVNSSPAVVDGVVYIGGGDKNVYALNAATGAQRWSYTTGNKVYSSPAVVDGVVYIGSVDKKVYGLDAATGAKKWSYTTGDEVTSSPAVVDGVVYVGSFDRNVYALDAATGANKWFYTTGDKVTSSPAVVDGVVYIGSRDKNVYALNAVTGPVGSSR